MEVATLTAVEILAYALAATIYLGYLLGLRRFAEKLGRVVLGLAVGLHLLDIGARCVRGVNPVSSTPEAMSLVAFLVAAGYLGASLRYRLAAAGGFAVFVQQNTSWIDTESTYQPVPIVLAPAVTLP